MADRWRKDLQLGCLPLRHRAHGARPLPPCLVLRALAEHHRVQLDPGRRRYRGRTRRPDGRTRRQRPRPAAAGAGFARHAASNASYPRATALNRAPVRGGRCGGHPECPAHRPHPLAPLRTGQTRRDPHGPRPGDLRRHQRPRPGRAPAHRLQRPLRRPRTLGRIGGTHQVVSIDLWESYLEPATS